MKRMGIGVAVLCCVLATGCFEVEEELTLNADGSGSLELRAQIIPQAIAVLDEIAKLPGVEQTSPLPLTEPNLRKWIEEQGLDVNQLTLQDTADGGKAVHVALQFADLRVLNAAQFSSIALTRRDGGAVEFKAVVFEPVQVGAADMLFAPGADDFNFAIVKFLFRGAHVRGKVRFPGEVLQTNGELLDARTVLWNWTLDELDGNTLREGQTAVFDGKDVTFELPVGKPKAAVPPAARAQVQAVVVPEARQQGEFKVGLAEVRLERKLNTVSGETSGELEIQLAIAAPEGLQPVSAEDAQIERAVTDAGEELALAEWRQISMHTAEKRTPDGVVREAQPSIRLSAPSAASTTLTELKGRFTLICSGGTKDVRFAPLSAWVGKRLEHPDLGDVVVYLDGVSAKGVVIRCSDKDAIKRVRFEGEFRTPIDYSSWGSMSGTGQMIRKTYDVDVPPEGAMILEVHQDRKKYTIPFEFRDVLLP